MTKLNDHLYVYYPLMMPRPGGLGCAIYIVKGEKGLLQIDASTRGGGIDEKKFQEMVADGLDYAQIQGILCTHAHPDHVRGIPFWADKAKQFRIDLPVYIHAQGVKYIEDQTLYLPDLQAQMGDFAKYISYIPHGLGEKVTNLIWGSYFRYENVLALSDNQEFDLGNVIVKAIYTPGHAHNHTVYQVIPKTGNKKYLISGDLISFKDMEDGKGLRALGSFNTPLSSCKDEITSLNRVLQDPPDELHTAHYHSLDRKSVV